MEKYEKSSYDNKSSSFRVDFDDIPNSQIVYHEKKTDSPDGFNIYKPSKFVQNFNNQHTKWSTNSSNWSGASDS